jgi:hypothetical protein
MCGKAYSPRFIYAWPTARYAVMGGDQAAGTLVDIKIKQLERSGKVLSEVTRTALFDVSERDLRTADRPTVRRCQAVDRQDHRPGDNPPSPDSQLELAASNPEVPKFNVGVAADVKTCARRTRASD